MSTMYDRLNDVEQRYAELTEQLADPDIATNPARLMEIGSERAEIEEIVNVYQELRSVEQQIQDADAMIKQDDDQEMVELAQAELDELHTRREPLVAKLRQLLVPKDPNDEKEIGRAHV